MEETLMLILLVLVMLIGSYLAGSIPLIISLSEEKLRVFTIFGAGLLVGTALTVIIPEGVRALYDDTLITTASSNAADVAHIKEQASNQHSSTIGLSLVLGFVFMMLIDQISSSSQTTSTSSSKKDEKKLTATIGLVVHAAADGIALGAAATTSHHDVEIIVFLAIMLHKAPAAFGLVSFLLHEGYDRKSIRKHLGIFSLSAPLLTLLTYFGIGQEQKETLNSINATGIAMLFSAGTFLYVATVHVLPELTHHNMHEKTNMSSLSSSSQSLVEAQIVMPSSRNVNGGLKNIELFILICGALMPLLLTVGHHH